MINSINTNVAAYYAQANIGNASSMASASVSRLSSGNRIVKASDDVAALSIGTSLRTQVTTLRVALVNASQGTSLLQVADGALSQITEMLQRQKAIALQAGSGSLTNTDRAYLNQEFQALKSEIDRLTGSVTFNGVKLINGALSDSVRATSNTTNADRASMNLNFTVIGDDDTIILNGVTITFDDTPSTEAEVQRGATIAESLENLVTYLNSQATDTAATALSSSNKILLSQAIYSSTGNMLTITAKTGGNLAENFRVDSADINGSGSEATATILGKSRETVISTAAINVSNIDSDAEDGGSSLLQASTTITLDSQVIYTVQTNDSLRSVVNGINAYSAQSGVTAFITGSTGAYRINLRTADAAATGALAGTGVGTGETVVNFTVGSLIGGGNTGLRQGAVRGVGNTGGDFSLLTDQTQNYGRSVISFPEIAAGDLTSTSNFGTSRTITINTAATTAGNLADGGIQFTFTTTDKANKAQTEITIGDTLQETLDNAVEAINAYAGSAASSYSFQQIQARREGNNIIIESRQTGNALDIAGGAIGVSVSLMTGGSASSSDLSNTSNTGIDTRGVMNANFVGTIQGFTASYVSADTLDLSVTVGGIVYTARRVDSTPTSNTDVRFVSETGGYFDVKLRANQGLAANNSADAATFANRLNAAFSGVTFYQSRDLTSYNATGSLIGSSVNMQLDDFSSVTLENINVSAPSGSNPNGSISFTINGETYTALTGLSDQLGAYSVTRFVSASDPSKFLEFRNGSTALSFATDDDAADLEAALKEAFGVGEGATALSFQVGATAADTLSVSIGNATTENLYNGATLDVLSQSTAAAASAALDTALAAVTTLRANVGALQSRFNFAATNIQISVQNQDAARGELLDTDIAAESTNYATAQVKLQAGISVLAQANQQLQSLLKLIG